MSYLEAILFGTIQGFAEMLPISSSGHLVLFPWLFNIKDPGLAFDVALHFGTFFALVIYFFKDWIGLGKGALSIIKEKRAISFEQKLVLYIILASIPGVIAGVLLEKYAETSLRSPLLVATTLTVVGALLIYADYADKGKKTIKNIKWLDALLVGTSQAIAIVPGVSRSGITMTTGLLRGIKREDAAKFSFLMSAPIIAGAAAMKLGDLSQEILKSGTFYVAFLAAVISSFFAIKALLSFVKKHRFYIFAYYRFALAALVLIVYFARK